MEPPLSTVVMSLAVFVSPSPLTIAMFVTLPGAFAATLTVRVMAG